MNNQPLRCAAYCRVSTVAQAGDDKESIPFQERKLVGQIGQDDNIVHKVYKDQGISGSHLERPAFLQMMDDARGGIVQAIYCYRIDRFSRSLKDFIVTFNELVDLGVEFISLNEGIDSRTPYGTFMVQLMALLGELERSTIRERTMVGKRGKAEKGKYFAGRPPYGYRWNKKAERMELNEEQSPIVREMIELYISGKTTPAIARVFTKKGYPRPDGKALKWNADMISRTLRNPCLRNEKRIFQHEYKQVVGISKKEGEKVHYAKRKSEPTLDGYHIEFPALMTPEEWLKVKHRRKNNRKKTGIKTRKYNKGIWLASEALGSSFRCGVCKDLDPPVSSKISTKPKKMYQKDEVVFKYICAKKRMTTKTLEHRGYKKCKMPEIEQELVDNELWDWICEKLSNPMAIVKAGIPRKLITTQGSEIGDLKRRLKAKQAEIDNITGATRSAKSRDVINSYVKDQERLASEIKELRMQIKIEKSRKRTPADAIRFFT
jgi:DNA invertase Pin-like site-specific DNA recombinase